LQQVAANTQQKALQIIIRSVRVQGNSTFVEFSILKDGEMLTAEGLEYYASVYIGGIDMSELFSTFTKVINHNSSYMRVYDYVVVGTACVFALFLLILAGMIAAGLTAIEPNRHYMVAIVGTWFMCVQCVVKYSGTTPYHCVADLVLCWIGTSMLAG
jgi:hypothetical protein